MGQPHHIGRIGSILIRWSLGLLVLLTLTLFTQAEENQVEQRVEAIRAQLEMLNSEIEKFKTVLGKTRNERSRIEDELQRNEENIAELHKQIRTIERQLDRGEKNLDAMKKEQQELNDAKTEQQGHIVEQVRTAYALGTQENLKLLLNQEDPAEISRMLTYYDYFNKARADQIERYEEVLESLDRVKKRIFDEVQTLQVDSNKLKERQSQLISNRKERAQTLARLNAAIASRGTALEKMTLDRQDLEDLLTTLARQVARIPEIQEVTPFPELQGKMRLPVQGRVANHFGSRRMQGKLKWQGVFITVEEGTTVHAIHHGRVVFSDWLRGFGLLMIINHGDGYMSLYGHNQTLERDIGDWVKPDEVISTAGNTGGHERFGLYFEIRQNGQPQDPERWCLARV